MQNYQWRSKFIELSENIFRELGFSPPSMLELEGLSFELLHSPSEYPEKILVVCKLGQIPASNEIHGMQELMRENLLQMRVHGEWYGIDGDQREVHLLCHKEIDNLSAVEVLQHMRKMAENSHDWQSRYFDPAPRYPSSAQGALNSFLA